MMAIDLRTLKSLWQLPTSLFRRYGWSSLAVMYGGWSRALTENLWTTTTGPFWPIFTSQFPVNSLLFGCWCHCRNLWGVTLSSLAAQKALRGLAHCHQKTSTPAKLLKKSLSKHSSIPNELPAPLQFSIHATSKFGGKIKLKSNGILVYTHQFKLFGRIVDQGRGFLRINVRWLDGRSRQVTTQTIQSLKNLKYQWNSTQTKHDHLKYWHPISVIYCFCKEIKRGVK